MMNLRHILLMFFVCSGVCVSAQKLKRSDRAMAASIEAHVHYLSDHSADSAAIDTYITSQFRKAGCQPASGGQWTQSFTMPAGREISNAFFSINGSLLKLYDDYFPLPCSASRSVSASVSMDLAENGVPWFSELREILEDDSTVADTAGRIASRAREAAQKGASALVVYNNSAIPDLVYQSRDTVDPVPIPVVFVRRAATRRHLSSDSGAMDLILRISMHDHTTAAGNILAKIDNKADSSVLVTAGKDDPQTIAVLLELSKQLKGKGFRGRNYMFAVFPAGAAGRAGRKYFALHGAAAHTAQLDLQTGGLTGVTGVRSALASLTSPIKP